MDGLISLICLYLFGTVIVVGIGIVIQLTRNHRAKNREAESTQESCEED